ncbi:MAG: L-threonylcarbamoyladenylate synthase [Mycoplasma sp.]
MKITNLNASKTSDFKEIINKLASGIPAIIKTDTQWGIICAEQNPIYELKKRPLDKKLIQLVHKNFKFINLNQEQKLFLDEIWPGKVTIIHNSISYRRTGSNSLNEIVDSLSINLYSSSANLSNKEVITSFEDAKKIFELFDDEVLFISTNEDYENYEYSTIIDIDNWTIIREGSNLEIVKKLIKKNKDNYGK